MCSLFDLFLLLWSSSFILSKSFLLDSVNSIFYGNRGTASAQGSGVIISDDGYILTNNHVVNSSSSNSSFYELGKASKITVKLYNADTNSIVLNDKNEKQIKELILITINRETK